VKPENIFAQKSRNISDMGGQYSHIRQFFYFYNSIKDYLLPFGSPPLSEFIDITN